MVLLLTLTTLQARAQTFGLRQATDTTAVLTLTTDSTAEYCRIPYRTYRFCTGDIDGDGRAEAMVGVIKRTRFDKEMGRRLFIYKNLGGRIRPLWMGSRLGGILEDFRYTDGKIRSLETDRRGLYYVAEYKWHQFGLDFERFLIKETCREEGLSMFEGR